MGKLIKYWPLVLGIAAIISTYAIYGYSIADQKKLIENNIHETQKNREDIASLKALQMVYSENQRVMIQDIKEILLRIPKR